MVPLNVTWAKYPIIFSTCLKLLEDIAGHTFIHVVVFAKMSQLYCSNFIRFNGVEVITIVKADIAMQGDSPSDLFAEAEALIAFTYISTFTRVSNSGSSYFFAIDGVKMVFPIPITVERFSSRKALN